MTRLQKVVVVIAGCVFIVPLITTGMLLYSMNGSLYVWNVQLAEATNVQDRIYIELQIIEGQVERGAFAIIILLTLILGSLLWQGFKD